MDLKQLVWEVHKPKEKSFAKGNLVYFFNLTECKVRILISGITYVWHGVEKSQTWLSDFTFTFYLYALEKEMATHSSVLAWRIPGMGSRRVRHNWSDLAVAAAAVPVPHTLSASPLLFFTHLGLTKHLLYHHLETGKASFDSRSVHLLFPCF